LKKIPYTEGDNYQAVELPYKGGRIAMVVLLPKEGQFRKFESALTEKQVARIIGSFQPRKVGLLLPKFHFDSKLTLNGVLSDMGMPSVFGNADFSGMTPKSGLFLNLIIHQADVLVDEEGTEAAAATAVMMMETARREMDLVSFKADRPFIFLIRDTKTGAVLFVGRVLNPKS
jgi:serpin B